MFLIDFFRRVTANEGETSSRLIGDGANGSGGRTAWVISFTPVFREPRVRRQAQALSDAGWRVVVVGFDGPGELPNFWHFARLPTRQPYSPLEHSYFRLMRFVGKMLFRLAPKAGKRFGARLYYANISNWRHYRNEALRMAREHPELKGDLVISHDYFTGGVGVALAEFFGARFAVDCHEYSAGQYMHDPDWVRNVRPWVTRVQDDILSRADAVTTVCDGIADLLNKEQTLKRPVAVVRSVPFRQVQPYRPTRTPITVLYHGDISYVRGLHKAVKSLPLWRDEFRLVIRGPGSPEYISSLEKIAADLGVRDRLTVEPPVPFDEIVPAANAADIGYFVHKDVSPQKRFALPNKYFEYVMAGLALCISDLPEMARLTREFGLGVLVQAYDEKCIADAINSFTPDSIDRYKRASLAAAETLNWDNECHKMIGIYEGLFEG